MLSVRALFLVLSDHLNSLAHNILDPASDLAQQLKHFYLRYKTDAAGR
jgi:hypothetical protein